MHAIIFANTECPGDPRNPKDQGIGQSVTGDYYRMKIEMTTIASFIEYDLKTYYFTGGQEQFNKKNLDNVIDNLRCGPQDIVFFYYSGHGSRSVNEATDFPQMNLVVDPYHSHIPEASANYPLYNVMERLKEKKPRLTIVIGDLCNSVADWVTPKALPSDKAATQVEDAPIKFYKDLFLKFGGSLIAASSKPGQTSGAFDDGGAFTLGLMEVLQVMVANGMEPDWTTLFEGAIYATEKLTNGRQTPIYDSGGLYAVTHDAASGSGGDVATAQPVQEAAMTGQDIVEDETALGGLLTAIGDESNNLEKRIKMASDALRLLFESPRAVVKVVGRDGKTVVSTKTAKAYLDWLTVTTNLYKVVPVEGQITQDKKFSYLQVHEMYKQ